MGWDEAVPEAMAGPPWETLLPLAAALFHAGSAPAWWLLVLLLAATRRWTLAVPLALGLLGGDLLSAGLKELVARPRPEGALFTGGGFSFPSGHALRAAVLPGLLAALRAPPRWILAALGFAFLVGSSRLAARAHYPSDVLAGLALGLLAGAAVGLAWRRDVAGLRTRVEARAPGHKA